MTDPRVFQSSLVSQRRFSVEELSATSTQSVSPATLASSPQQLSPPSLMGNMPAVRQFAGAAAPLPSPTSSKTHGSYFGSSSQAAATIAPQKIPYPIPTQRQNSGSSSSSSEASDYLKDFSLIAEAAKRAQMAVIARDLEDVSL